MTTRLKSTGIPEDIQTAKNLVQHIESIDDSPHFFTLQEIKNNIITTLEDYEELNTLFEDPELGQTAQEDSLKIEKEIRQMIKLSSKLLLSTRKFDSSDAILEVQAGAGGLEAGVFAGEILQLYIGYIAKLGFDLELLEKEDINVSGTLKSGAAPPTAFTKMSITGTDVFRALKYECGVHRVQRVPVTGTKNDRLQTSTCSVAVYPQPNTDQFSLSKRDLKIENVYSSGAGGQNVNKNATAVRILHIPTGIQVKCQQERTASQNHEIAMRQLSSILYNQQFEEEMSKMTKFRKSQIGNMNRNEKIRSYNFARNAISDHRLSEVKTVPNIGNFLLGDYGYDIIEEFRHKLDDIDAVDTLRDYLENTTKK